MGNLTAFLAQNAKQVENVKLVVSDRFTDEDVETWRAVITDLIEEYKGVYGEAACTAFGVQ